MKNAKSQTIRGVYLSIVYTVATFMSVIPSEEHDEGHALVFPSLFVFYDGDSVTRMKHLLTTNSSKSLLK